jgi:hypothetical protein
VQRGLLSRQIVTVATGDGDRAPVATEDTTR